MKYGKYFENKRLFEMHNHVTLDNPSLKKSGEIHITVKILPG